METFKHHKNIIQDFRQQKRRTIHWDCASGYLRHGRCSKKSIFVILRKKNTNRGKKQPDAKRKQVIRTNYRFTRLAISSWCYLLWLLMNTLNRNGNNLIYNLC